MPSALGIDIGSVAVKLALVSSDGKLLGVWSRPILAQPAETLGSLIAEVPIRPAQMAIRIGVTGNGREIVHGPVLPESEVVALTRALPILCPNAHTAIEIGGHSASFVVIEPQTLTLLDYGLNQQCAAGSGSFFEQQAARLGLDVEAFAQLSAEAPRGATVAGRCSVFAKSDMIHLQQKGRAAACGRRQYSQRSPARRRTRLRKRVSIRRSDPGQVSASLRLNDADQIGRLNDALVIAGTAQLSHGRWNTLFANQRNLGDRSQGSVCSCLFRPTSP